MTLNRIIVHFHTGEGISEVDKIINDHGGKNLPSPLIYPPMQLADVTPDTIEVIEAVEDVNDVKDQGPIDE